MFKLIGYIILMAEVLVTGISCNKETIKTPPLASLRVVNTVTGGSTVRLGSYGVTVGNNQSFNFTLLTDNNEIYVWPVEDSLHPYYHVNKSISVAENEIYTLFLGGTPLALKGILVKESLPHHNDSIAGIRFVHLAPGGPAVNVTLSTSSTVKEFSNITYEGITEFKSFPAKSTNTSYTFQVRNADTGEIITSITMSGVRLASFVPRFRNVTLVFSGMVGGQPKPGIIRINHY